MQERHATAIPSEAFDCTLETKDTYSQLMFTPLKEIFLDGDLAKCLTPAHEERTTVPDKWDTQQVKAAAKKYGDKALAIVENARIPGAPRLKFTWQQNG